MSSFHVDKEIGKFIEFLNVSFLMSPSLLSCLSFHSKEWNYESSIFMGFFLTFDMQNKFSSLYFALYPCYTCYSIYFFIFAFLLSFRMYSWFFSPASSIVGVFTKHIYGIALLLINFYGRQTQYFEDFSFLLRERFFATVYFRIFPKAAIVFSNPLHLSADVLLC